LRNSLVLWAVAATTGLLMTSAVVRCQDPTTPEPASTATPKPAPKPHKVWTDDDVATLRSPADDYLAQKEAQAQAEDSAKLHRAADPGDKSSPQAKLPNSLEEVERAIKDSLEDIRDQKDTLARLSKELHEIPEEQRVERTKQIERRTAVLQESEKELKSLQAKRDDLVVKAMIPVPATPSCDSVTSSCPN
jgi:hypothetical protein